MVVVFVPLSITPHGRMQHSKVGHMPDTPSHFLLSIIMQIFSD